jgi:hypothetical protein
MTRPLALFFAALAAIALAGAANAGGRCPFDNGTAESQAPATTADGAGAASMTPIPPAPPAIGG